MRGALAPFRLTGDPEELPPLPIPPSCPLAFLNRRWRRKGLPRAACAVVGDSTGCPHPSVVAC
eukprot:12706099-Alexandrium_andersonii.AAC.1